ncbi:MAG TPA: hypothetical protein VNV38_16375 [Stellaceae bacterium]|jgi:hypothetical protein|nr:hypothetical protein [Stellaceae bacterium]
MLLVEIEKPANQTLAAWFSEMRTWLDLNRYASSVFTPAGRRIDRLIYRISFERATEAHKFSTAFAGYSPTVRLANRIEREQLRVLEGSVAAE